MPVFRLDPVTAELSNPNWQCSTIGAQTCWVRAESDHEARWAATTATIIARGGSASDDSPLMPWNHGQFATCTLDPSKEGVIAPGQLLDAGGRVHPISFD